MKKPLLTSLIICLSAVIFITSCNNSNNGQLFDGNSASQWQETGNISINNGVLDITGADSHILSKHNKYKNFELNLELRTKDNGKGYLGFHTNNKGKGYKVAINNDRNDATWWRMTGSLLSVRNIAKTEAKANEWFKMQVRVVNKNIRIEIDGHPVVNYTEPPNPYRIEPNKEALLSSGAISLFCTNNGTIELRNADVRMISDDEAEEIAHNEHSLAIDEQNDDIIKLHQEDFPVLDYHVHLKGGLTLEEAGNQSRALGINYTIAPNCGIGFPITNDTDINNYLDTMRAKPFILAMQAEGREWIKTFSKEGRDEFDFVFTDALTFTDNKGRRTRIWLNDETFIDGSEQEYMDLIVDKICSVLQEPADVYVNPCFLPEQMNDRYDEFWTDKRIDKVVDALIKGGMALEINNHYKIPSKRIIMKAKAAGAKFTFGTNNLQRKFGKLEYCIKMKKECGITAKDMYKPMIKQ